MFLLCFDLVHKLYSVFYIFISIINRRGIYFFNWLLVISWKNDLLRFMKWTKLFVRQNNSSDIIFVTSRKIRHFCPTKFCPIRYSYWCTWSNFEENVYLHVAIRCKDLIKNRFNGHPLDGQFLALATHVHQLCSHLSR